MYLQGQQGIVSDLMNLTRVLRGLKESIRSLMYLLGPQGVLQDLKLILRDIKES